MALLYFAAYITNRTIIYDHQYTLFLWRVDYRIGTHVKYYFDPDHHEKMSVTTMEGEGSLNRLFKPLEYTEVWLRAKLDTR